MAPGILPLVRGPARSARAGPGEEAPVVAWAASAALALLAAVLFAQLPVPARAQARAAR